MKIPFEIYELLTTDIKGEKYYPKKNLSETQLKDLKDINDKYKRLYGIDLISF